jgi:hypothetical protein
LVPSVFRGVVGNFNPPPEAEGRLVKNHFTLIVRKQHSEFEVLTFGAKWEVGHSASDTVHKVPKSLGPKVSVLPVQVS